MRAASMPFSDAESCTGSRVQVSVVFPNPRSSSIRLLIVDLNVSVSKWFSGTCWRFDASGCRVLLTIQ